MADDRRRRFSQIERPRGPGGDGTPTGPSAGTGARFGAVGEPAGPPPGPPASPPPAPPGGPGAGPAGSASGPDPFGPPTSPVAPGHVDRFRPAVAPALEVEERGAQSQPFVRCCRCETDASRFASRCSTCGADLDTDEQRAFNERLWAGRQADAAAEAEAHAARQVALDQDRAQQARAQRELHEAMAREVGERERWRYDTQVGGEPSFGPPSGGWGGATGWGQDGSSSPGGGLLTPGLPVGFRLLRLVPPGWRVAVGLAVVAVPALLFLAWPGAGLVLGALVLGLFTPRWRSWRRRGW